MPRRVLARWATTAAIVGALGAAASAHDIPSDVVARLFVKADAGHQVDVILRVPLAAIRDMNEPIRQNGTLDLGRVDEPFLLDAAQLWIANNLEVFDGDGELPLVRMKARVSLPSDQSFDTFEAAREHVLGPPLPPWTELRWVDGVLDVLFVYSRRADGSDLSIHPRFARLGQRVVTVVRFVTPSGAVRAFELPGDPGVVRLDPRWHQAALRFVALGFSHILDGIDHLLFLFCLVIPFRRLRPLVIVVTSFTVAHSATLIGSAFNLAPDALWFPPLVETLIAASIVYMALENIVAVSLTRRWLITFAFGLVHGFGFSFALRQTLQFAGSHLLTSLFAFNVGVELGQLLVLILLIPALDLLFRFVVAERMGTIILSAIVAHTAWHWMTDRFDRLRQYRFQWPAIDAAFLVSAMRWGMVVVAAAALVWLARERWKERRIWRSL